jgi:hypothetical protein
MNYKRLSARYHSPLKRPEIIEEMVDCKVGTGSEQDGTLRQTKEENSFRSLQNASKAQEPI